MLFASVYPEYDAEHIFSLGGFVVVMGSAIATGIQRWQQRRARSRAATCPLCREAVHPGATVCPHCRNAMQPITADGVPVGQSPPLLDPPAVQPAAVLTPPPEKRWR